MIQRAKKEVFGHFIEVDSFECTDIAYSDREKRYLVQMLPKMLERVSSYAWLA